MFGAISDFFVRVCWLLVDNVSSRLPACKRKEIPSATPEPSRKKARLSESVPPNTDGDTSTPSSRPPSAGPDDPTLQGLSDDALQEVPEVDDPILMPFVPLDAGQTGTFVDLSPDNEVTNMVNGIAPPYQIPKTSMSTDPIWSSTSVPSLYCLVVDNTDEN